MCVKVKRQWTLREWKAVLKNNGFEFTRFAKGSHQIWTNREKVISFPFRINSMLANRLIKENNLITG